MEVSNELYEAIKRYYSLLSKTGYRPYSQVEQLIIFIFIEELLNGSFNQYITEEDYNIIAKSLNCLYGSCMIPYPTYKKAISEVLKHQPYKFRTTESGVFRVAETIGLRIIS
jgi:hypothetical protein